MGYLVRMINKEQNWSQYQQGIPQIDQIKADSISELVTSDNCISTWYIDTPKNIDRAVLALASGFRNLDSIKLVLLDIEKLEKCGLTAKQSEETGLTKAKGYEKYHYDIIDLNYQRLGKLAQFIISTLHDSGAVNIEKKDIIAVLSQALVDEIVDFDCLDKNLKAGLASAIMKELKKNNTRLTPILGSPVKEKIEQQIEKNKQKTTCMYELQCPYWLNA